MVPLTHCQRECKMAQPLCSRLGVALSLNRVTIWASNSSSRGIRGSAENMPPENNHTSANGSDVHKPKKMETMQVSGF